MMVNDAAPHWWNALELPMMMTVMTIMFCFQEDFRSQTLEILVLYMVLFDIFQTAAMSYFCSSELFLGVVKIKI